MNMFLDEELLNICETAKITTQESIQELNITLCRKCEDYYKNRIGNSMDAKLIKTTLDRVFNLWDSFVRMAENSNVTTVVILSSLFKKHSFKEQFLSNEDMYRIYNSL